MITTHKITMDLTNPGKMPRIHAVQDDRYCRNLELTLLANGEAWSVPESAVVQIRYCKPDGTGGEYDTLPDGTGAWSREGNVLTIALAPQVLTVAGAVSLSVTLVSGEARITTFGIGINVKPRVNADLMASEDYVNILKVGTVEALPADAQPTAKLAGNGDAMVLNLGIPVGKTPQKGVDYWTEEDVAQLLEKMGVGVTEISLEEAVNGYWDKLCVWTECEGVASKWSNRISVTPGDGFLYTGNANFDVPSVVWFDANGDILGTEQYEATKIRRVLYVPEGAHSAMFNSYGYTTNLEEIVLEVTHLAQGDNREIVIDARVGAYCDTFGTWWEVPGGTKYTNLLLVSKDDTFFYTGYGDWGEYGPVSVLWYDVNGAILASQQVNDGNSHMASVTVTPPEGAALVQFYSYSASDIANCRLIVSIANLANTVSWLQGSNYLWMKKYVACGDSFTAGDFADTENRDEIWDEEMQCYKTYAWWIASRNRMTLVNEAISGTTMHNDGTENAFSVTRYQQIPADADYITLCFGLNETTAEIGTLEDTTNETVMGAWNIVLEYLLTNMPYAKIGILIPDAWCSEAMREALISVATYWGIPWLDLKGDKTVPLMIGGRYSDVTVCEKAKQLRNAAFQTTDEDSHPNPKAHKYRATVIENFLRSL